MAEDREPRTWPLWAYSAILTIVGFALASFAQTKWGVLDDRPVGLPWPALLLLFSGAERLSVGLDVRDQARTLTFAEAPLTLGLFLAEPWELVLAAMLAIGVENAVFRRSPPIKVSFNVASSALQAGVALVVFHTLLGSSDPTSLEGLAAGFAAALSAYGVSAVSVTGVMVVLGIPIRGQGHFASVLTGLLAPVAGSLTVLAATASLWKEDAVWTALFLLEGILAGVAGYAYVRLRDRHRSLAALNAFTFPLVERDGFDDLLEATVRGLSVLLHARRVILLIPGGAMGDDREVFRVTKVEMTGEDYASGEIEATPHTWRAALEVASTRPDGWPLGTAVAGVELESQDVIIRELPLAHEPGLVIVDGRLSEARQFDDEDHQVFETAAGHAGVAIYNEQLVNELRAEADLRSHQALHDDLTGWPNARGLIEEMAGAPSRSRAAFVNVRVASYREVNETLGHAMGDELLLQVANRLSDAAPDAIKAKTAGDEFTLVLPSERAEAELLAWLVAQSFDEPIECGDVTLAVSVGIGIALSPSHGTEIETLLRRASLAASRTEIESSRVAVWDANQDPYDPQRLAMAADLRGAIDNGELEVMFQPQQRLNDSFITSAEALVRWNHPRLGLVGPNQFIPAAEYTGIIDALTAYVLQVSARTCAGWRRRGWDLEVGVNISARNLARGDFASGVRDVLLTEGLPASALTLELTESSVMTRSEEVTNTLAELKLLGVGLSIDDFGTGYSSFDHLRHLPVTEVKIDKSFVQGMLTNRSDEALVENLIGLGHGLNLEVVVEGVETVEIRQRLKYLEADRIQGYLLSRPIGADDFSSWLADRPVRLLEGDSVRRRRPEPSRGETRALLDVNAPLSSDDPRRQPEVGGLGES